MHPAVETWEINQRVNEYLLSAIKEEQLKDTANSKGRNVGEQFAHINNVRLMWIKAAAPELMEGLIKVEKENSISKKLLLDALKKSSTAISTLLEQAFEAGKVKGFKPHPQAFLGYLLAHEAHHRGQLILALKENGHLPDKKILFGLWEWGVR
jgi:uncharacterized damage-inducible protein DinB